MGWCELACEAARANGRQQNPFPQSTHLASGGRGFEFLPSAQIEALFKTFHIATYMTRAAERRLYKLRVRE